MFDEIRSERLWRPLRHRYPHGGQWFHDTENMIVDVADGLDRALLTMKTPFRAGLEFARETGRRREGFKMPPIKGFFIFDGKDSHHVKLKPTRSFAELDKRPIFIGDHRAVMVLVNAFLNEVEKAGSAE